VPRRLSSHRWLALGALIAAVAASVAIAIWQSDPRGGYWQLPGIAALAAFALGVLVMLVGFFKRDSPDDSIKQVQTGGADSVNVQAGRDINVDRPPDS
jgi:hypothetical protein